MAIKRWNASTSQWELVGTPGTASPSAIGAASIANTNTFTGQNGFGLAPVGANRVTIGGTSFTLDLHRYTSNTGAIPGIEFKKSLSDTVGAHSAISSTAPIGRLTGMGSDGTNFVTSSQILFEADGTVSTNVIPGKISFSTVNSSGTLLERMRITSLGTSVFGGVATGTPPSSAKVYVNNGSNENIGNPTWGGSLVINEYSNTLDGVMGLEFKTRADSNGSGWRISSLANNPDLVFQSRSSSATWTERMRILSSGNVGIGRTPHFNNTLETTGLISARTSGTGGNTEVWAQAHDFWETPTYTGVGLRYWGTAVAGNRVTGIPFASLGEVGFQNVNSALVHTNSAPLAFASYSIEGMRLAQNQYLLVGYTSSNGAYRLQVNSQIFATSSSIATSDGRFKDNVLPISSGLDIIDSLNPVSFDWKEHPVHNFVEGKTVGFIAQEVKEALKDYEWVDNIIKTNATEAVLDEEGNEITPAEEFLGIAESNIIPLLVAAVKELRAEVNTLKAQINN
jgi:hypothetical protein